MSNHQPSATAAALASLQQSLTIAARLAEGLQVSDTQSRDELIDCLAMARINILRMTGGGAPQKAAEAALSN